MSNFKPNLIILLSVLLLISTGLLFTALYHFYYRTPVHLLPAKLIPGGNKGTIGNTHDSLLKIYTETIRNLERDIDSTWNTADSLRQNLDKKLTGFYKMQKDLNTVLENPSNVDLEMARKKILELQERIAALHYTNLDVEKENKRLNALLKQQTENDKIPKQNISKDGVEKFPTKKNSSDPDVFSLLELQLSAIQTMDDKEQETNLADLTEKFSGSFKVRNNFIQDKNVEIMFVVLQPDGKVLFNSDWDAGTFETREGKKMYSGKVRFDYNQGEAKQLMFTLPADKFQQGNYTLKIYHNGIMIGKTIKNLS